MRGSDKVQLQLVFQDLRIPPLHPGRHGSADIREGLVTVHAAQFYVLPVQQKTRWREAPFAESNARLVCIFLPLHVDVVQSRMSEVPQFDVAEPVQGDLVYFD